MFPRLSGGWSIYSNGSAEAASGPGTQETLPPYGDEERSGLLAQHASNVAVAAGKGIKFLLRVENFGRCSVKRDSVYGAALAIPQIARSVEWAATYKALTVRSFMYLAISVLLQVLLLSMMNENAHVMRMMAGQMHLCDFGANIDQCPDGPNCKGPGGTMFTYPRLRSFNSWSTRTFFREALKTLFPERAEDINTAADPGEYGMEDYYCRLVCCMLFVMAVFDDLRSCFDFGLTILAVPNHGEKWISYQPPDWMDKNQAKRMHGWSELDLVKFKVAGMPIRWKVLNFFCVLLPKFYIWVTTVITGTHYLMDTAGITDLVINCMALRFVVKVDEMFFERLSDNFTKYMMEKLEDLTLFEAEDEGVSEAEATAAFEQNEFGHTCSTLCRLSLFVLPRRLLYILAIQAFCVWWYYHRNCDRLEDGSWVSKPIYQPEDLHYNPLTFLYGLYMVEPPDPTWQMPA